MIKRETSPAETKSAGVASSRSEHRGRRFRRDESPTSSFSEALQVSIKSNFRSAKKKVAKTAQRSLLFENGCEVFYLIVTILLILVCLGYGLYKDTTRFIGASKFPTTTVRIEKIEEYPEFGLLMCPEIADSDGSLCPRPDLEFNDGITTRFGAARKMTNYAGRSLQWDVVPEVSPSEVLPLNLANLLSTCYILKPFQSANASFAVPRKVSVAHESPSLVGWKVGWKNATAPPATSLCYRFHISTFTESPKQYKQELSKAITFVYTRNRHVEISPSVRRHNYLRGESYTAVKISLSGTMPESGSPFTDQRVEFFIGMNSPFGMDMSMTVEDEYVSFSEVEFFAALLALLSFLRLVMSMCWTFDPYTSSVYWKHGNRSKEVRKMVRGIIPMLNPEWSREETETGVAGNHAVQHLQNDGTAESQPRIRQMEEEKLSSFSPFRSMRVPASHKNSGVLIGTKSFQGAGRSSIFRSPSSPTCSSLAPIPSNPRSSAALRPTVPVTPTATIKQQSDHSQPRC